MKNILYKIALLIPALFVLNACFDDLNTVPLSKGVITSAEVYDDPENYIKALAKLYAGLSVSGQQGPAGQADIAGIDEGFGQYLRGYWYHQELPTDEAIIGWNDQTIKDFHDQDWTSADGFTFAFYSRIFYQIPLCNEFLRETEGSKLDERGVDEALRAEIKRYRAEARFLRALSYWHALDIFRNVPFVTEDDGIGAFLPEQTNGPELFSFLESELKAIDADLAAPRTNPYGRADQAAAWMLLAKLYLNAEVYTGTARNADCLTYCEKILDAGYILDPVYQNVFLADNHNSEEIIFPATFDGVNTRTWGGMTFVIRAGIGGSMDPVESGVSSGWGGTRTTKEFVQKFPEDIGGIIVEPVFTGPASKVYVAGTFQGWVPGDAQNVLTKSPETGLYEGHKYFADANTEILITTLPTLSNALGDDGADGTLEAGGANIIVAEPGLYFIEVDLTNKTYVIEKRAWGIAGDATAGGWSVDEKMSWDEDLKAMKVDINLTQGAIKFRSNDSWDVNLGDTGADAKLEYDGDDIQIEESGLFEITLYLNKLDYSYGIKNKSFDSRGFIYSDGQNLDIDDVAIFTEGYAINKFKNVTSDGTQGSDTDFPDTDFPMFRLADVYLMASEAILRDGGNKQQALDYFNAVRSRAYGGYGGEISLDDLDLDMILDERARELYWECHRRTDLIRFGKFTNDLYLWAWKGGVKEGAAVEDFRILFPIPSADLGANPNLEQNEGY